LTRKGKTHSSSLPSGDAQGPNGVLLTLWTRLAFGLGQTVEVSKIWIFETFVLFYYTQVVGLSPALAGVALLLAMIADAVTDPLVGQISDGSTSRRFGRRHAFMFASLVPAAAFIWMLFSASADWSQIILFGWVTIACIGLRTALTFFAIPYSAQMADLSDDRAERTRLAMFRMLTGTAVRYFLILAAFEVFFASTDVFANGQENVASYLPFALFCGTLIIVSGTISGLGTLRPSLIASSVVQKNLEHSKVAPLQGILQFWREALLKPSNLRTLITYSLLVSIMTGIYGNLILYFGTYYWALTPSQIGFWSQLMIPGMIIAIVAGRAIIAQVELKPLLIAAIAIYSITLIAPVLMVECGLFDRTSQEALAALYLCKVVSGFTFGLLILCIPVMAAEVADEWGTKSGRLVPALVFGSIFFTTKAGSGLGGLVVGGGLEFVDIPSSDLLRNGTAMLTSGQLSLLGWFYAISVLTILIAIMIVLTRGYHLSQERHRTIIAMLKKET